MLRYCIAFIVCIVTLVSETALAQGKRVALVIGNGDYKTAGKLKNPVNDANLVANALAAAKFSSVEATINLGIAEFRQALRRFQSEAEGAEVALIYYAGHGLEASGVNWLVPVDAELVKEGDLEYEAIRIDLALRALAGARMRLLVLDACRNNPLTRSWTTASRSVERGLRPVEADDVLVLFAAAPGSVASDGTGTNSPFATAVAKWLPEPGLALQLLGGRVRDDVLQSTRGAQRPYVSASITGEPFYLAPPAPALGNDDKALAQSFWAAIKDTRSTELLQSYLERFPNGANAVDARALRNQIDKEKAAALDVARREAELRRAEDARQAAEQMKREAERKAADARLAADLRKAQLEAKAARDALAAAEKERETVLKATESARKTETDTRKSGETIAAALPTPITSSPVSDDSLIRSIQRELKRVGCEPGPEDGKWGANVKEALGRLNAGARLGLPTDGPKAETLAAIIGKKGRVCPLQCSDDERAAKDRCVAKAPTRKVDANPKAELPRKSGAETAPPPARRGSDGKDGSPGVLRAWCDWGGSAAACAYR